MEPIRKASLSDADTVYDLTHSTIASVYPRYYPRGVVDFFHAHHSREHIVNDIAAHTVLLLFEGATPVATATIHDHNEVCRLFVAPDAQKKGYGSLFMVHVEGLIAQTHATVHLDASLPAHAFYVHRGYRVVAHKTMHLAHGDFLCYALMEKRLARPETHVFYDGRVFTSVANVEHGEVSVQTRFCYHQKEGVVWAEYEGGAVKKGFLVGTADQEGNLTFLYQHVNENYETRCGSCSSVPELLPDGRIRLHESWQWLDGALQKGTSVVEEPLG